MICFLLLSDLHFNKSNASAIEERTEDIANAIAFELRDASDLVLCFSGDIANTGAKDEFSGAASFLDRLGTAIELCAPHLKRNNRFAVFSPGNHDCDFSWGSEYTRSAIIDSLRQSSGDPTHFERVFKERTAVEALLGPKQNYYEFLDNGLTNWVVLNASTKGVKDLNSLISSEVAVTVATTSLRFAILDSSLFSQQKETPQALKIPTSMVRFSQEKAELVIAIFHHNLSWLYHGNRKELLRELTQNADLLVTGHEHQAEHLQVKEHDGNAVNSICVPSLWSAKGASGFAFISYETNKRLYRPLMFEWRKPSGRHKTQEGRYEPDAEYHPNGRTAESWRSIGARAAGTGGYSIPISPKFSSFLTELGMNISHRSELELNLDHLFVWPDVSITSESESTSHLGKGRSFASAPLSARNRTTLQGEFVKGSEILKTALAPECLSIITGAPRSGKTTLAKVLCKALLHEGRLPVYIDWQNVLMKRANQYDDIVEKAMAEAYPTLREEDRKQDYREKVVVVMDSMEHLDELSPAKILQEAMKAKCPVIAFCDVATQMAIETELTGVTSASTIYNIEPMGVRRRQELVEKWVALYGDGNDVVADHAKHFRTIWKKLTEMIGKRRIPPYPYAVLSVLTMLDTSTPLTLVGAGEAGLYSVFVQSALHSTFEKEKVDVVCTVLAELAFEMFRVRDGVGNRGIADEDFQPLITSIAARRKIKVESDWIPKLLKCQILYEDQEVKRFRYRYLYHYFVAKYISDGLRRDDEAEQALKQLVANVRVEEFVNILVFLAFHTNDPILCESIESAAHAAFSQDLPSEMDSGMQRKLLGNVNDDIVRIVYDTKVDQESMSGKYRAVGVDDDDEVETSEMYEGEEIEATVESDDALSKFLVEMNSAIRLVQLLGQLLKNHPGKIPGDSKVRMAREVCDLSLRTHAAVMRQLEDASDQQLKQTMKQAKDANPESGSLDLVKAIERIIGQAVFVHSQCAVVCASAALASESLEPVVKDVFKDRKSIAERLIQIAVRLAFEKKFPTNEVICFADELTKSKNHLARFVLGTLVVRRFYLFGEVRDKKQRVLAKLGVDYKVAFTEEQRRKVVGP